MAKNRNLDQIAKLIGLQNAIVLTRRYGGRGVSIPTREKLHETHPLVLTIGLAPAYALADEFGGERLHLPPEANALLQVRNTEIVRRFVERGESIRSIAIEFGLDRAMIQKIIDAAGHKDLRISRSVTYT